MKKFVLVLFFSTYHMFIPFVMVGCGSAEDTPYNKLDPRNQKQEEEIDCFAMSYLIEDCVEVIQESLKPKEDKKKTEEQPADDTPCAEDDEDCVDPADDGANQACDPATDENCPEEGEGTNEDGEGEGEGEGEGAGTNPSPPAASRVRR